MRNLILGFCLLFIHKVYAQDDAPYYKFTTGVNVIAAVFRGVECNNEFMLNKRIGITADLGYQFSTGAGKNLNLKQNKIQGYYFRFGPRFYFAPHSGRASAYVSGGYVYSYFKQSASLDESDFYEPYLGKLETKQKLDGTYIGVGAAVRLNGNFKIDFGTNFYFFTPDNIEFVQDYGHVTNAQPGFGHFIFKNAENVGLGIGPYCSIKYTFGKK